MESGLVLFDGVPGSGKTTTSRQVSEAIAASGVECSWALEESGDHPFFGPAVRSRHREPDYGDQCIKQWRRAVEQTEGKVWVLEACALQSTVRFMFEEDWDRSSIEKYWAQFVEVVTAVPVRFVYFRHRDVERFIRSHTVSVRADVWEKISGHVVGTKMGSRLTDEGVNEVPIEFWVRYGHLCDDLVDRFDLPVLNVDVGAGWDLATTKILEWLATRPVAEP